MLYLHDITKDRIGGTGVRNIRLLEDLLGRAYWDRCTLVTTKWGRTITEPERALHHEEELQNNDKFWKEMRTSSRKADMKRFANTQDSALEIIEPYLTDGFVPQLTHEMVDPAGPKHALGATSAGQQISEYLNLLEKQKGKTAKTEEARKVLQQKFSHKLFQDYQREKRRILEHQKWTRGGRWVLRLLTLGGCIAGTVVTLGAASPAFAAVPLVEVWAQTQRKEGERRLKDLQHQYEIDRKDVMLGISSESLHKKGYGEAYGRQSLESAESSSVSLYKPHYGSSSEESLL